MRTLRHVITWGLITLVLWSLVAYGWYIIYLWVAPVAESSFIVTFAVIPVSWLAYRAISKSSQIAKLSRRITRLHPVLRHVQYAIIAVMLLSGMALFIPRLITAIGTQSRLFDLENVPPRQVAIVFGAGLFPDGGLSPLLQERVKTATDLYLAGKVKKILMSGDNRFEGYNEPAAMRDFAISLGVSSDVVVLDYAGRRTYDTCYRAHNVFGVREAILITQDYHLSRAVYTCNKMGIDAIGIPAVESIRYLRLPPMLANVRESLATLSALWELYISHPVPVLGSPEPMFSPL